MHGAPITWLTLNANLPRRHNNRPLSPSSTGSALGASEFKEFAQRSSARFVHEFDDLRRREEERSRHFRYYNEN